MKVLVGLGNPGRQYADTRHNIGFMVIDRIVADFPSQVLRSDQLVQVYQTTLKDVLVLLVKPQTYMNLSGIAVSEVLQQHQESPENLVVIYDDLDLSVGQIRIRPRGGHGGHKGMRSIIVQIQTQDFVRVRMGIGRPESTPTAAGLNARAKVADYVLQPFTTKEQPIMAEARARAVEAIQCIVVNNIEAAMNQYNRC